jgi:hypothetical protein
MRHLLAVVFALICLLAATPGFARTGTHHVARAGVARDPYFRFAPLPPSPSMGNRIPAPLAAPAQAPVINGPISQPNFRGLTGIGQ